MTQTATKPENSAVTQVANASMNQLAASAISAGGSLRQQGKSVAELVLFDDRLFERVQKWGQMMAGSKSMVPRHLQGNPSDCAAVIMQALRWGVDPYACAQKTHLVQGTLGYEAQLINSILLANAPIEGRPRYEKIGDWTKVLGKMKTITSRKKVDEDTGEAKTYQVPDWKPEDEKGLGVRLLIKLKGQEVEPFELLLAQATVRNSTLWASDPFQQLCYLAIKRWARLHCPDVIMGVYTPDELEEAQSHRGPDNAVNITPQAEAAEAPTASKAGAFAASAEAQIHDPATGEIIEANKLAAQSELPVQENGASGDDVYDRAVAFRAGYISRLYACAAPEDILRLRNESEKALAALKERYPDLAAQVDKAEEQCRTAMLSAPVEGDIIP